MRWLDKEVGLSLLIFYLSALMRQHITDWGGQPWIWGWLGVLSLHWRHNGRDNVSNYQPRDCLLNRLFRRRSKKTSKFRVTSLCAGNSPGTGEFPAQMASNAENVSIWWRHHVEACSWMTGPARLQLAGDIRMHISYHVFGSVAL